MSDGALDLVTAALDRAAEGGRTVDFWWRDDDAVQASPALDRLLALADYHEAPLAIAAIPALLEPSLPARLRDEERVNVLVHGFAHADHAGAGEKPSEYGRGRPLAEAAEEVGRARDLVRAAFGEQAAAVFVPPWNRIAPEIESLLPQAGYAALSTFGPAAAGASPRLARLNTHLDPVDWRGGRGLLEPEPMRRAVAAALDAAPEPIGLLTHHLAFDEALWAWCEALLERLAGHPAARLRAVSDLVGPPSPGPSLPCLGQYGTVRVASRFEGGAR